MSSSSRSPLPEDDPEPVTDPLEPKGPAEPEGKGAGRPGEPTDHDLVRAAQRGEELGFELLVKRHEDRATRVAWGLVANREDARDLAQDAFLRVFRNLDRFDFKHEFTTWLYRIVTNLAIDYLRKRRPHKSTTVQGEEGEAQLELADAEAEEPFRPMERAEIQDQVRACIDRLAPHFRTVMILRELEGLPCTEIAEIVGATHVTVRWRLHRGRKLFQDEWERMERSGGLLAELEEAARNQDPEETPSNSPEEPS